MAGGGCRGATREMEWSGKAACIMDDHHSRQGGRGWLMVQGRRAWGAVWVAVEQG